jgi:hypothetical protein
MLLVAGLMAVGAQAEDAKPRSLFNGKDLSGWHVDIPALDKNPEGKSAFIVRDGNLVSLGTPRATSSPTTHSRTTGWWPEYRFPGKAPATAASWYTLRRREPCTACSPSRSKCK